MSGGSGRFPDAAGPDDLANLPITPEWAWGGSVGEGVRVGVVDSGVDASHPELAGHVEGWASFQQDPETGRFVPSFDPHEDVSGHGTACAGIVLRVAPRAELVSIRVLGPGASGRGRALAAGLRWGIEQGIRVLSLSLGTTQSKHFAELHELAEEGSFRSAVLVVAAGNQGDPGYPARFSSVISVAALDERPHYDPLEFHSSATPPPDFGAPGLGVEVPWPGGGHVALSGNSVAAPHVTGIVARILAKHPNLRPYQVKAILRATARNVRL